MDTSNGSIDEVRSLVAERQRYEDWLQVLEGKRDSTPAHVFERVERDYRSRRDDVTARLGEHVGMLRSLRDELEERLSGLDRELSELEDARMEAMLRTEVGEFDDSRWERTRSEVESGIGEKSARRDEVSSELDEVRSLLESAAVGEGVLSASGESPGAAAGESSEAQPDAPDSEAATSAGDAAPSPRVADDAPAAASSAAASDTSRFDSPVGSPAPTAPASGAHGADGHFEGAEASAGTGPIPGSGLEGLSEEFTEVPPDLSVSVSQFTVDGEAISIADEILPVGGAEPQTAASPEAMFGSDEGDAAVESFVPDAGQGAASSAAQAGGHTGGTGAGAQQADDSFDDLAFLRSVVDSDLTTAGQPGGAGVTEQQKTLRCTECGTMNLPTEWYCERCGGELAAF